MLRNEIVFNLVSRFKLDGNDPLNWLLLIIKVTRFVSRPIEDGMDELNLLFPINKVPREEYSPIEEGMLNCRLLFDTSNVTRFVRDVVKVGNPPVNLLELSIREFRELSIYVLGSGPTSEAPTILRDVKLDNWLNDDGRLPP